MRKYICKATIALFAGSILFYLWALPATATGQATLTHFVVEDEQYHSAVISGTQTENTFSAGYSAKSIRITPYADDGTTITVNNVACESEQRSSPVTLQPGENTITIVVAADGCDSSTYTLHIQRLPGGTNANLGELSSSRVAISPQFDAAITEYTMSSEYYGPVELSVFPEDNYATAIVNGVGVRPHQTTLVQLTKQDTAITIVVTAEDGTTTKTYVIHITWLPNSNDWLYSLTANTGVLVETDNINDTEYNLELRDSKEFTLTPTAENSAATIEVNGVACESSQPSGILRLVDNALTVTIKVTAESGGSRNYTVHAYYPEYLWQAVGNKDVSGGKVYCPYLYVDDNGTPYIAFSDGNDTHSRLSVMMYNGSRWVYVGEQYISKGRATSPFLAKVNGTLYAAFSDNADFTTYTPDTPRVLKFTGGSWDDVGSGLDTGFNTSFSLAAYDGRLYLAYTDNTDANDFWTASARIMVLSGSTWTPDDGADSFGHGTGCILRAGSDTLYCCYNQITEDLSPCRMRVMKRTAGGWTEVYIKPNGTTCNAFEVAGNNLYATTFNSSSIYSVIRYTTDGWEELPLPSNVNFNMPKLSLALSDGELYVAYYDISKEITKILKYDGEGWVQQTDIPACEVSYGDSGGYIFSRESI